MQRANTLNATKYETLNILVLLFVTLSSCGQGGSTDKQQMAVESPSLEAKIVFQKMRVEFCNCTTNTMRDNKPSTTFDSCYKTILDYYTDTLKTFGYDTASTRGKNQINNGLNIHLCRDLMALLKQEYPDEKENKLLFKGEFVSQKKSATGEYEITFRDSKTKGKKYSKRKTHSTRIL